MTTMIIQGWRLPQHLLFSRLMPSLRRYWLLFSLVGAGLSVAQAATTQALLTLTPAQLQQMQVQWASLQAATDSVSVSYPAEVLLPPTQTRVVTAPQAGLITQLKVSVGDRVKQGQVIGQLSSPDLVALQSQYLQSLTQAQLHSEALKRDQTLFKDGIIAQRRLQETQSAYDTSQALLHQHQQTLQLAGMGNAAIAQLGAQRQLHHSLALVAPISGQIMEQQQQVGARVDMAMPIFTISQPNPLWLMIQVPVTEAARWSAGMTVSLPKQQLTARVETVLRQLNKNSQSTQVRAVLTQGTEQLSVGQIVDVALLGTMSVSGRAQSDMPSPVGAALSGGTRFSVPRTAVARQGEQAVLFVRQAHGIQVTPVQVVQEQGQQLIVQAALPVKTEIAVQGVAALKGHWLGMGGE